MRSCGVQFAVLLKTQFFIRYTAYQKASGHLSEKPDSRCIVFVISFNDWCYLSNGLMRELLGLILHAQFHVLHITCQFRY